MEIEMKTFRRKVTGELGSHLPDVDYLVFEIVEGNFGREHLEKLYFESDGKFINPRIRTPECVSCLNDTIIEIKEEFDSSHNQASDTEYDNWRENIA